MKFNKKMLKNSLKKFDVQDLDMCTQRMNTLKIINMNAAISSLSLQRI